MALVEGVGRQLAYTKESSWAVPGTTTYTIARTQTGAASNEERTQIQTSELNTRRAVTSNRLGTHKPSVSVPYELFYGGATAGAQQFDDFMESWMCNSWTAAASAIASQTVTVGTPGATTEFTVGTSIGTIVQGDWVKVSGYTDTQIGNNGYYRVASVSSLVLTLVTPDYLQLVAGAAYGTAVVLQRMAYVSPGTSVKSLAFDEAFTDSESSLALAKLTIGCIANEFSLTINPDQVITGTFTLPGRVLGSGATRAAAATVASAYSTITAPDTWTAAATYQPMTGNDTLMRLMVDNTSVAIITALTINGTNNTEQLLPIGSMYPYYVGKGTSSVSGTMSIYLTDASYWSSFQNETLMGISLRLMDPDNGTLTTRDSGLGYGIEIPNIKITSLSDTINQTNVVLSVNWQAIELSSSSTKGAATTNMRISHLS